VRKKKRGEGQSPGGIIGIREGAIGICVTPKKGQGLRSADTGRGAKVKKDPRISMTEMKKIV